ncbi:hypothetical protein WSM22_09920 [Cytophagales bacterium WSM2-2]|nr:hypothetical protein WSM22_09920 [Cytophagales bacterium WSM2-2]
MTELNIESKMHPLNKAGLTLLVSLFGFVLVGPLIGFFFALPFSDGNLMDQLDKLANPVSYPEFRLPLYIMQGCATLIGLALLPALLSYIIDRKGLIAFFTESKNYGLMLVVIFVMTISFMVTDSVFINWNANLHFPEFMGGFESWARDYEERAEDLTKYLTAFTSRGEFALAFVVIAILPAIGEELVFRGMLQTHLLRATKNPHVAIWVSAILFSAFHLQFFGFVPRMLLGALFGYLYYWSGSLLMPAFAHFVNNGFSVVMLYLHQKNVVTMDVESTDVVAPWPVIVLSTLITAGLLYYYKTFLDSKRIADGR